MKKAILVVDDSETIIDLLNFTLERENFDVYTANSVEKALKFLDGRLINLIITDLHMPGYSGIDFTRQVRLISEYRLIPILLLTTETRVEQKKIAKEAGATGWIVKPFVPEKLMNGIRKLIR